MAIFSKLHSFLRFQKIKHWYQKYERILLSSMLILGVIRDAVTFQNIDITATFLVLGISFFVVSLFLIFQQLYDAHHLSRNRFYDYIRLVSPLALQLLLGALLNGVFVFYFFSGTFFVSWPLIVVLVFLMVSNDVFKKYYTRVSIQLGVFYFLLFSLSSVGLAFLTQTLSSKIFFLSGVTSLIFMFGFVELLLFANHDIKKFRFRINTIILSVFLFLNILYITKVIPPIPLSLREISLAHSVEHVGSGYELGVEPRSFFQKMFQTQIFHKEKNGSVYVYTAIFAPEKLQTKIIHEWQYFDETKNIWEIKSTLSFSLSGGRDEGFRGYTFKNNVQAGKWRVYIKTENGQVLGRMSFVVENTDNSTRTEKILR